MHFSPGARQPPGRPKAGRQLPRRLLVKDQNRPAQGAGGQVAGRGALWSRPPRGGGTLTKTEPPERLAPPAPGSVPGG